jgi:23S rRNA pseudouridine955/2504/2580 synthase
VSNSKIPQVYVIEGQHHGRRLDRWLRDLNLGLTQGLIEKLLRKGLIKVNDARAKSNYRLFEKDKVLLPPLNLVSPPEKVQKKYSTSEIEAFKKCILHEDEDIFVLNKPTGLAVQGGNKTYVHVDGLLEYLPKIHGERPRIVHRLDRDTSGILLIARTLESAQLLGKALKNREVKKTYLAIVIGKPDQKSGTIEIAIEKKPGRLGERMRLNEKGQSAVTKFRVLDSQNGLSLLELTPLTGRTHQLRIHCADVLGTPILGDGKYGGRRAQPFDEKVSLHLHASRISFAIKTKKSLSFFAPLPPYFLGTMQKRKLTLSE